MSGELHQALWRRARVYLREAQRLLEEGEYDVALAMAEQAVQLALKAVYLRLFGYMPRDHNIRRLIGRLAHMLEKANRRREADRLRDFAAAKRWQLLLLEDAYTEGRYGLPGYAKDEAQEGVDTAKALLQILESVESTVGGDGG